MKKKLFYFVTLIFIGLLIIYWGNIKDEFTGKKVYFVFNLKEDYLNTTNEFDNLIYPKKFIFLNEEKKVFGIRLSESEEINFELEGSRDISDEELKKIKKTSFDSIVHLFNEKPFNYANEYYIILVNQEKNKNYVFKTSHSYIVY
ncbi:hypothetical protein [Cellulophaga sp. L1A9]|uniref:hypothetical protein n=1 Tax=Cellulophaga sp. L1A9 TaxID=2686362 RepID=UPI00131D0EF0|nr:hypothetical protein [Cellulophaga sp. L1A9]